VAVKIKLKRMGKIRAPYYRIVIADARTKRDGRAIEEIGKYHPKAEPSFIEVDSERAQHWLSVGAKPTDPVRKILEITGDWQKFMGLPGAEGTLQTAQPRADRKAAFAAAVAETLTDIEAKPKARGRAADAKTAGAKAKADTGKADTGKADTGKADTGKPDTGKADTGKADTGKADTGKADTAKAEKAPARAKKASAQAAGTENAPAEAVSAETVSAEEAPAEAVSAEPAKTQAEDGEPTAAAEPGSDPAAADADEPGSGS